MRAFNNYLENQKVSRIATASAERRKRLRLKRIVVSEHNYLALKKLGYAGDSFNDMTCAYTGEINRDVIATIASAK